MARPVPRLLYQDKGLFRKTLTEREERSLKIKVLSDAETVLLASCAIQ